jgi:rod shape determining protein RodA
MQAIGSGEITGKGYLDREVNVPENHTDFIFTVIGEEYGFIGASIVIILYFLLIFHIIRTALETNSHFNAYVCAGIISMTAFHVFENIGMSIQLLPITGIPLPFISYGGSSLMGNMFAMGIIFSIRYYHRNYMFATEDEEE